MNGWEELVAQMTRLDQRMMLAEACVEGMRVGNERLAAGDTAGALAAYELAQAFITQAAKG